MRYDKKDAETMPARHTVFLDATDMERAAIRYVRFMAENLEHGVKAPPSDSAVLSLATSREQDHMLIWHTHMWIMIDYAVNEYRLFFRTEEHSDDMLVFPSTEE